MRTARVLTLAVLLLSLTAPAADAADSISIEPVARYHLEGGLVIVELHVRCEGGNGAAFVELQQFYPETYEPIAVSQGGNTVTCSGTVQEAAVNIVGGPFDPGKAFARASLVPGDPEVTMATAERWIDIRV